MKVNKGGPLSRTDLEFLGYRAVKEHEPWDFELSDRCRVFEGTAVAGISSARHWFIYLLAGASNKDIQSVLSCARIGIFQPEQLFVVVPKSLSVRRALVDVAGSAQLEVFEDLMWKRIRDLFTPYLEVRLSGMQSYKAGIQYVEPVLVSAAGETAPIKHLVKFFSGASTTDPGIAVVKADAGVGKTTLAVMVADELLQQWESLRVIPILLTAQSSWRELEAASQGVSNPWDLLRMALDREGYEFPVRDEELFARIMQQGYIAFIFDGFDELRGVDLSSSDSFAWMGSIASDSSARLMVTTRSSFWDRELGKTSTAHQPLDLKPFNVDNARDYYKKYLTEDDDGGQLIQRAMQLHTQLRTDAKEKDGGVARFVDLPGCAAMVADYVKGGGSVPIADSTEWRNIIDGFFTGILERERVRQGISLKAEDTKAMFGDVAVSYSAFSMEDIEIAGADYELTGSDLQAMRDHAFLSNVPSGPEMFRFRYEFLLHYLRADRIFVLLEPSPKEFLEKSYGSDLRKLIWDEADGKGNLTDQMANFADKSDLSRLADAHQLSADGRLKSFAFHVVVKAVASRSAGASRAERTGDVLDHLRAENNRVSGLCVSGSIADLSLRGWTIADSRFTDLSLLGCDTEGAVFSNCSFSGDLVLPPNRLPQFEKCEGYGSAKLVISSVGGTDQHIRASDVRAHLETGLRRFRNAMHFIPLNRQYWKTGRTRPIEDRYQLLDIMLSDGLVEEVEHIHIHKLRISPSELGNVRDFLDNGMLIGAVNSVFLKMKEKIGAA